MGGRKRKTEAVSRLDEVDRTLYSSFCSAANSLSQLYTQAMNHQKQSFQAGERHANEKLYQWILRQHEEGSRVSVADILSYLQNEMEYGGEDVTLSPRLPLQLTNSSTQPSPGFFGQMNVPRAANSDQVKNSVFSNALSSPIRRSLQPYQLAQGGGYSGSSVMPTGNGIRYQDSNQIRDSNSHSSNDTSMDMNSDSPAQEPY